ncbi:early nodulin-like protein 1 [Eucalyptus grandis]|uniref:early nodulin-like protein 1 n=1 Tax=Eucalyptus grandis TaxID=71139 RepID=UPI00192F04CD|nr:early nodulin-like protein 1 [Eucalyptus grandis]
MAPVRGLCKWVVAVFAALVLVGGVSMEAKVEAAREFRVGGAEGWHDPAELNSSLYSDWATRNRFRVGDSLNFEYKNDSVLVVDKWSYYHCNTSNPIAAFNNGNSTFTLDQPGFFYFISGTTNHCKNGQRLIVDVMSPHRIPRSTPPSIANPPQAGVGGLSPYASPLSSASSGAAMGTSSVAVAAFMSPLAMASFAAMMHFYY